MKKLICLMGVFFTGSLIWGQLSAVGEKSLLMLKEGQSYTIPKGHEAILMEIFMDAGEKSTAFAGQPADFCGFSDFVPYKERTLRINQMTLVFTPATEKSGPQNGAGDPSLRVQLPIRLPAGTTLCVPKKHTTSGVLLELHLVSPP
jgi:hypothetical protein